MPKKGDHWKQQERNILRRKGTILGEIQDHNTQINELPEEGLYVVVNQRHTYFRGKGDDKIRTVYRPDPAYYDAWGFPRKYRIKSYTKGRDNALDKMNDVVLALETPSGGEIERRIKTCQIAIGILMLQVVGKDEELFDEKTVRERGFEDFIVVGRNEYGRKKKDSYPEDGIDYFEDTDDE